MREDCTTSELLEEVFHFEQDLRGDYNEVGDMTHISLLREIDAQNYLLSVAKRFNIPSSETDSTISALDMYKKKLEDYVANNKK